MISIPYTTTAVIGRGLGKPDTEWQLEYEGSWSWHILQLVHSTVLIYSNCVQFDHQFAKIPPKMHLESRVAQIHINFGVKLVFVEIDFN